MNSSQIILNAVLFAMIFSVALELRPIDFLRIAKRPIPIIAGLVAQFMLLPVARSYVATLVSGAVVLADGVVSEERPGRLLRAS